MDPQITLPYLDHRLEQLEKRIIGNIGDTKSQINVIDSLLFVNEKIRALTAGRDRDKFSVVNKKLQSLELFITNPHLVESKYLGDDDKMEMVIVQEDRIRRNARLLEDIARLEKSLNKPKVIEDDVIPKINQLRLVALKQYEGSKRINDETKKLLQVYNQVMKQIKTQLAYYDAKLSRLESDKETRGKRVKGLHLEEFD